MEGWLVPSLEDFALLRLELEIGAESILGQDCKRQPKRRPTATRAGVSDAIHVRQACTTCWEASLGSDTWQQHLAAAPRRDQEG